MVLWMLLLTTSILLLGFWIQFMIDHKRAKKSSRGGKLERPSPHYLKNKVQEPTNTKIVLRHTLDFRTAIDIYCVDQGFMDVKSTSRKKKIKPPTKKTLNLN